MLNINNTKSCIMHAWLSSRQQFNWGEVQVVDVWMMQYGICSLLNKERLLFIERGVVLRDLGTVMEDFREKTNFLYFKKRGGRQRREEGLWWRQESGREQGTLPNYFFLLSLKWLDQFSWSFINFFSFTFYNESKDEINNVLYVI